jgi:hypothetical protein
MKCVQIKINEQPCKANAMANNQYCYLHNPDIPDDDKLAAQIKGGKAMLMKLPNNLAQITVETPSDVVQLLTTTITEVRTGAMDPKVANTVGYLAGHLIKAMETAKTDKRMAAIESLMMQHRVA